MNKRVFVSVDDRDGINLYEINGDLITANKRAGFKISG
jgi:hypothetical protein